MSRFTAFLYGTLSYLVFVATFLYALGFITGVAVPKTIDTGSAVPLAEALIVDLMLMSLFAVQHSVMARRQFKEWWTQYVPKSVERSTFCFPASRSCCCSGNGGRFPRWCGRSKTPMPRQPSWACPSPASGWCSLRPS